MYLTIFTPTYNRGYTLSRLYHSLQNQTCYDFEWIIVDDGSTDNTTLLVNEWVNENNPFQIRYFRTENRGKSMAHNLGARKARGVLFINVDSDDWLLDASVEIIINSWVSHEASSISGMIALRGFPDGSCRTIVNDKVVEVDTLYNYFTKKRLSGEMLFVLRTEHLRKHEFPSFGNEKFVPDGYLYIDMFGKSKQLLLIKTVVYLSEYLDDGMTKSNFRNLTASPLGYKAYCYKRFEWHKKLKEKFFDAVRLDAILLYLSGTHLHEIPTNYMFIIAMPFGWLMYIKRFRKWKNTLIK